MLDLEKMLGTQVSIDLINPNLKSEKEWFGKWNNNPLLFNIRDKEFMNAVFNGGLSFKNGDVLFCDLFLRKGNEVIAENCNLNTSRKPV